MALVNRTVMSLLLACVCGSAGEALAFPITAAPQFKNQWIQETDADPRMSGLASLFNPQQFSVCSGAAVKLNDQADAHVYILTNGHCVGFQDPGTYVTDKSYSMNITLFDGEKKKHSYATKQITYATMTGTDVALLDLELKAADLENVGVHVFTLAKNQAAVGDAIWMGSGLYKTIDDCQVDGIVHALIEDKWSFSRAYKYQDCDSKPGTSGSPLVSTASGEIIGINNTHNTKGELCTFDNPCEVSESGEKQAVKGMNYGQRTDVMVGCANAEGRLDLSISNCGLLH